MVETCDKVSEEDLISQLPDSVICDILCHLSTKEAVRTSVLSTKWRNLWQWVPGLDLDSHEFSNFDAFVSFTEKVFDSHRKSWLHKLRLSIHDYVDKSYLNRWVDSVTRHSIQNLDVCFDSSYSIGEIPPLSIYNCETLVHLRLYRTTLANAEFVSLPCVKTMHLEYVRYSDEILLEKLISGSPVLEDLTIIRPSYDDKAKVLKVCSLTLKRIHINESTKVVIDAPLLQSLKTRIYLTKNFQIISSFGFSAKLDIDLVFTGLGSNESVTRDILTDISMVRDLVISRNTWKEIFLYSKSGPVLQFCNLSRLNAGFSTSDLEMLPTILESCPKLESFILELVDVPSMRVKKMNQPKQMFSTVPLCLVSSLKFVELKCSITWYERDIELVKYFLKNSTILKTLRLHFHYMKKERCALLKEFFLTMPRCSSSCEIIFL